MPGYGSPRDAIVSIWGQAVSSGIFLGSGAFISSRHVLTAKHVLKKKIPKNVCLGLVDGYNSIPVHKIHRHQKVDIALIELGRDFPEQGLVRLDCVTSALEKTNIVLYGVNPDTLHRDECQDYTIGTWNARTGTYLFDHAQRKGFSGGVAVSHSGAVGVITQRHTSEQQGVIVPLYAVREWLQSLLFTGRLEPNPVDISLPAQQTPNEFTLLVRREIGSLLTKQRLHPLRDLLLRGAAQAEPHSKPESVLLPEDTSLSIEASIDALHDATQTCLQHLTEQGSHATADIATGATQVLGWLVLLAVSETWVQEKARGYKPGQHYQHLLGTAYIALPVETEAGTEVVVSRLRGHQATLTLGSDGVDVRSPNRVQLGDLELGLMHHDRLIEVKKLIWNAVHKTTQPPEPFGPAQEEDLKITLEKRYQRGESHYILMPTRHDGPAPDRTKLLQLLRHDLPHLGAFLIGSATGEQVLVMPETRLMVLIREFLRMLGNYTPDFLGEGQKLSARPHARTKQGVPIPDASQPKRIDVFCSYAHDDEELRVKLANHLALLRNQGVIRDWHDRRISPGDEWANEIDEHLTNAKVILLLVSASFLASNYCYAIEMQRAMARHNDKAARVIPIILKPCDWQEAPFGKLQALPKNAKAITTWSNHDEAFTDVAKGIRIVVRQLANQVEY